MNQDQKRWQVLNALNMQIVRLRERIERLEKLAAEEHDVIRLP
mgnify:CR=1 FL=1